MPLRSLSAIETWRPYQTARRTALRPPHLTALRLVVCVAACSPDEDVGAAMTSTLTRRAFATGTLAAGALICCPACRARAQKAQPGEKILCAAAASTITDEEKLLDTS